MISERSNAVTLQGNPFTLLGPELKVGDQAPDFVILDRKLKSVTLADIKNEVRIFSVVPSLDTPVCDAQTRRFNEEIEELQGVSIYTISMDLPFAQNRWCSSTGVENLEMLSDHRDASFGVNYGTLIKELRLNCRAIFVVDSQDILRHVEYVKEVADHPNYDDALNTARELTTTK